MKEETSYTSRGLVMELSVKHEHIVNVILAKLLGITPEESRSFGTSSHALSFNAKVNLLLDLKQLDKLQREKFQIFMEIRNKFAHLNTVDTFEKCFALLDSSYQRLRKIFGVDEEGGSLEHDMQTMFCVLAMDLTSSLGKVHDNVVKDMAVRYTNRRFSEVIKEKRDEYKGKVPSHAEAVDSFIEYLKNILMHEVDEKIKNKIPPHV
jgi:hypothetical protein